MTTTPTGDDPTPTVPAAAVPADPPGPHGSVAAPGWLALTASERGASHAAMDAPNQDAVAAAQAGEHGLVAAVADGHGHWRHLRSARGSRLAVQVGCDVGKELADRLATGGPPATFATSATTTQASPGRADAEADAADATDGASAPGADDAVAGTARQVMDLVMEFAVPGITRRWREAVLADLAADPFDDAEQDHRLPGDDPTIAYGSTLLLAVAADRWLVLAQIGDGDVVGVRPDGSADLPVPADPQLDGLVTTSLCGADPVSDFRVAVVDTAQVPLLAVLLATDGYGNAQVIEAWPEAFSRDLAWLLRGHDDRWLAEQLPAWTARCASADGSADDTTVALLLCPARMAALAGASHPLGDLDSSQEATIPAIIRGDTTPSYQVPPGHNASEPITVRMRQANLAADFASQPPGRAAGGGMGSR